MEKTIYFNKADGYRIIEVIDTNYNLSDLFETNVEAVGVFGYILQKWDGDVGCGWEFVDSCYGFIGDYETENHYIVDELISQTK